MRRGSLGVVISIMLTVACLSQGCATTKELSSLEISDERTIGEIRAALQESPDVEVLGHINRQAKVIYVDKAEETRLAEALGASADGDRWLVPNGLQLITYDVQPLSKLDLNGFFGVMDGIPVWYPEGACTSEPARKCLNQGRRSLRLLWQLDVCTIKPSGSGCLGIYNLHPVVLYPNRGCQGRGRRVWWPVPSCVK